METIRLTTMYVPTTPPAMEAPKAASKEGKSREGRI
ncbi:hypothetical protein GWE_04880 [Chlamydia psittaci NJ1]|nr:hypothetical protein AO9_01080 [Chlamydia psittaci Mat116]KPZ36698.1 hypothetical protein GWE_04880 [Chlamydia psittaci NJ1]KPZ38035.1 hypothetical protein GWG_04845 [Chlamydia psittaci DD34]KPZ39662.1 hypothetical protein GWI_03160 [Chlamydia psittaci str. Frances]KXH24834.1 hypothetical protein P059_03170 [Chlamydia psittaci UGA]